MLIVDDIAIERNAFALGGLTFDVREGEYFVLLGASGVGKTVLLEAIAGLANPSNGCVRLDGNDITQDSIQSRGFGFVYQDQALFPHLTVAANIVYGLKAHRTPRVEIQARMAELAEAVGIEELLNRYPGTLSGGQAQRVALARALAPKPRCLLLDEPLSALDSAARGSMRGLLRKLHRDGQTVIHVTHDYEEAISLATRVAIMEAGNIVQIGSPAEVFQHPKSEFVARFVGIHNFFKGELSYPEGRPGGMAEFSTADMKFTLLTDAAAGPGAIILRSEDITLSSSRPEGSARNIYLGIVRDVAHARLGLEVIVDMGVEMAALVTESAVEQLGLAPGAEVWTSFKATAAKFLED
ncbi:MAG: ABC transporter ATP-binding protein [Candidatus Hydrogenedentes bacterium]|jgi:molybdopterin-binding protein|nr:ABC transporter ATP-binding protein [Candidatus Hydrogenedentota bacterium]